ncbi:unnamed protein product [Didymodactylos carnosus]|uniref:FLYWCH-type domain-containing protein n=1 Tax=Didymodactylos carnosus TaxID=1234261 RepID=A0A815G344_9BILA|nr:unnamed protein product [Didymodactylos carnosus]CAF4189028.1 unnamed protein product [Didymodactylos carnosus]
MARISINGTTKQKARLDIDGFSYIKDRTTNEKTYWRCINYFSQNCRSRLHTCIITNNIVKPATEHSCKTDGTVSELRKFDEQIVYRALNTQETPDLIVTHCCKDIYLAEMADPSLSRVPPRDHVKRRIRMLRQDKNLPSAPNDPNFASVPISLTKTLRQDQFLRCGTGAGDDRIMVFGSTEQLDILQSVDDFLVDRTFKFHGLRKYVLYLGRLRPNQTRRQPKFGIDFWNMYHRTTDAVTRTNNAAEADHRRIGSVFQCSHPTLWSFLEKLIEEENATHMEILHINAGQAPKLKSKRNERFEKRLLNIISNPHADVLKQRDSIAMNEADAKAFQKKLLEKQNSTPLLPKETTTLISHRKSSSFDFISALLLPSNQIQEGCSNNEVMVKSSQQQRQTHCIRTQSRIELPSSSTSPPVFIKLHSFEYEHSKCKHSYSRSPSRSSTSRKKGVKLFKPTTITINLDNQQSRGDKHEEGAYKQSEHESDGKHISDDADSVIEQKSPAEITTMGDLLLKSGVCTGTSSIIIIKERQIKNFTA